MNGELSNFEYQILCKKKSNLKCFWKFWLNDSFLKIKFRNRKCNTKKNLKCI